MTRSRLPDALCVIFIGALAILGLATMTDSSALSPALKFAIELTWPLQTAVAAVLWLLLFGERIVQMRLRSLRFARNT